MGCENRRQAGRDALPDDWHNSVCCGYFYLALLVNALVFRYQGGDFAVDAYERGLYNYPEQTKDDLMVSMAMGFGFGLGKKKARNMKDGQNEDILN